MHYFLSCLLLTEFHISYSFSKEILGGKKCNTHCGSWDLYFSIDHTMPGSFVNTHSHILHSAQLDHSAGWLIGKRLLWSGSSWLQWRNKDCDASREAKCAPPCVSLNPQLTGQEGCWWLWQSRMETATSHAESFMYDSPVCATCIYAQEDP